jgi:hypothetical protein
MGWGVLGRKALVVLGLVVMHVGRVARVVYWLTGGGWGRGRRRQLVALIVIYCTFLLKGVLRGIMGIWITLRSWI